MAMDPHSMHQQTTRWRDARRMDGVKFRDIIKSADNNVLAIDAWGVRVIARGLLACAIGAAVLLALLR